MQRSVQRLFNSLRPSPLTPFQSLQSGSIPLYQQMNKRKIKIYTKTGDKGTSSLYNMERRPKDDPIFEALGDTDELNASIGIARQYCVQSENGLNDKLIEIQSRLMDIGSHIATPLSSDKSNDSKKKHVEFAMENTNNLEEWIDELDASLPALRNFILPSGGLSSAHLHLSRAICRRCERRIVALRRNGDIDDSVSIYMNRLSDFLFVASRHAAHHEKKQEIVYQKERKRKAKGTEIVQEDSNLKMEESKKET